MDIDEVNKAIAEYMGWRKFQKGDGIFKGVVGLCPKNIGKYSHQKYPLPNYSSSIDAQLSAWVKLGDKSPHLIGNLITQLAPCGYTEEELCRGTAHILALAIKGIKS